MEAILGVLKGNGDQPSEQEVQEEEPLRAESMDRPSGDPDLPTAQAEEM
jgi:hypothetical protein